MSNAHHLDHYTADQLFQILHRIGYPLTCPNILPPPTLATLRKLNYCCVTSIPFETLSLRCTKDRMVDVSLQGIFDRVVNQNRGGWCFSINRLAFELLKGLGFTVQLAMGRVTKPSRPTDPVVFGSLSHRVSIVRFLEEQVDIDSLSGEMITARVGSKWLFDLGFAATSFYPIEISNKSPITEFFGHRRRIVPTVHPDSQPKLLGNQVETIWMMEEDIGKGRWSPCHAFTEQEYFEKDCEVANFYSAKSPDAPLIDQFWVIQGTKNGDFVLLMGQELKIKGNNGTKERIQFKNEQDRLDALKKYFGIVLTDEEMKYNDQRIVSERVAKM